MAWNLLADDHDQSDFLADPAKVMVGQDPRLQVSHAAAMMEVSGWLEVVLSWPRTFVTAAAGDYFGLAADELVPGATDR